MFCSQMVFDLACATALQSATVELLQYDKQTNAIYFAVDSLTKSKALIITNLCA